MTSFFFLSCYDVVECIVWVKGLLSPSSREEPFLLRLDDWTLAQRAALPARAIAVGLRHSVPLLISAQNSSACWWLASDLLVCEENRLQEYTNFLQSSSGIILSIRTSMLNVMPCHVKPMLFYYIQCLNLWKQPFLRKMCSGQEFIYKENKAKTFLIACLQILLFFLKWISMSLCQNRQFPFVHILHQL